jgi:anaerobic magnesium-protoporphyrin IX monomethyl ester cyclase
MTAARKLLLVNPTITSKRSARFPLAVLSLATALEEHGHQTQWIDGNVDRDFVATARRAVGEDGFDAVGVTVMGGPQVPTAIEVSKAIRAVAPSTPIVWGGYFPTICPIPALSAPFVDYVVRGQGEETFRELLAAHAAGGAGLEAVAGLSFKRDGALVHNVDRPFSAARLAVPLPFRRLENPAQYLGHTYLGRRTAGYQAAFGCRFRCTFCGVATMFRGRTALPAAQRLDDDLRYFTRELGADSIQFYDHNFFDREDEMVPLLEVLAKHQLPWWCFARSDALVNMSAESWALVRRSGLRMAYIGAESPNDRMLRDIRKGTRSDQTLEAVEVCRRNGVIPELSFMLAPPEDPEGETEITFRFIREIKRIHPATEVMLYIYTPLPPSAHNAAGLHPNNRRAAAALRDRAGRAVEFPRTAEGWAAPEWVRYWCHHDAPWLSDRLRRRIRDFTTVLGCRFPTITDVRSPPLAKRALRALSSWRYRFERYDRPWELNLSKQFVKLHDPRAKSL